MKSLNARYAMCCDSVADPPATCSTTEFVKRSLGISLTIIILVTSALVTAQPTGNNDPAALDPDGDGVLGDDDICPFIPNPPVNGVQPVVCGTELRKIINKRVFLKSRTFIPPDGLDPALQQTQNRPRIHALLHLRTNDNGVVLPPEQRALLENLGVTVLGYLPQYTYYVSLPRNASRLQQINSLEIVKGISAILPDDRIAPQVRVRRPVNGRNADGSLTLDVDFFADVPAADAESLLRQISNKFNHLYDDTYRVTIAGLQDLYWLAGRDIVHWIDDTPDPEVTATSNAQAATGADIVAGTLGYRGNGLVLSMAEPSLVEPFDHPSMVGRLTYGNFPALAASDDHARLVAAIMIADGPGFPDHVGVLPEAELASYAVSGGVTLKRKHFGIPKEARQLYNALLTNNSWTSVDCSKKGEYTKRAKFWDRAVYDAGILLVNAAGNARGPRGDFVDETWFRDCPSDLFSLPHPSAAKNPLLVGSMRIDGSTVTDLASYSSAGPTADGRLKPDIVAPGEEILTLDFDDLWMRALPTSVGGTSAAAPFAAGIVGQLAEAFENQGIDSNSIAPARYKAIVIHTAEDVGLPGPDFLHGYGLIKADRAVRIAEQWNSWGREGVATGNPAELVFTFDINTPHTFFKATMAYDDEEGEHTSTMALQNDLDLTLVSPSGDVFFSYDLVLPIGATVDTGSAPCTNFFCKDRLNNVEMVMVTPGTGDFVEQGTWEARVWVNRLVSSEQAFSLVLTPPCPVLIDRDVTLSNDINCPAQILDSVAVEIVADGAELNCDLHEIHGAGAGTFGFNGRYVGIRSGVANAAIRNCIVQDFDIGIELTGASTANQLSGNFIERAGTRAIAAYGSQHTITGTAIYEMQHPEGIGIRVSGDDIDIVDNDFLLAFGPNSGADTIAVHVTEGSAEGHVDDNDFSGGWLQGIRLTSVDPDAPVRNYTVDDNRFEGIDGTPIWLGGAVEFSTVSNNFTRYFGLDSAGIVATSSQGLRPKNTEISGNTITGEESDAQTGIKLVETDNTSVLNNPEISSVGIGIDDYASTQSQISGNSIFNDGLPGGFETKTAINSVDSSGIKISTGQITHIENNSIQESDVGIYIDADAVTGAAGNTIRAATRGIVVDNADADATLAGNTIFAGLAGISVSNSTGTAIQNNTYTPTFSGAGSGIAVSAGDGLVITGNSAAAPGIGISIASSSNVTVHDNTFSAPGIAGIAVSDDLGALIDANVISANAATGILYASGDDAVLTGNEVNSGGAGVGIQVGTNSSAPPCAVAVDNILLEQNTLSGGALDVDIRCDVGTYTITP